jgi:hypothetical protein
MGILMKSNGEVEEIKPSNGKTFSLQELQGFVQGYIEIVGVGNKYLILNEEGKLNGLDMNRKATEIFIKYYGSTDVIVGDVLLADEDEIN